MYKVEPSHVIHVNLTVERCTAELYLNGIPMMRLGPKTAPRESRAVQQFLVAGTNSLEILVEPGPKPSRARSELRDMTCEGAHATATLARFAVGSFPDPDHGERMIEVNYRFGASGATKETMPRSIVGHADLGAIVPRWSFEDAPVMSMENAVVDEAHGVLEEIAAAYRSGSVDTYLALLEEQIRESPLAYPGVNRGFVENDLRRKFTHIRQSKVPVLPLDPSHYDFRLVASGRMLQCVNDDWKASLRLVDPNNGTIVPYRIFLARVGGRLRLVR